jgi:3-mercaptopyruvate sulfurtransferase SseA
MNQLKLNPEMQLATYEIGVGNGQIKIFVYLFNYTPKNRELLKNGIRGWEVDGGPVATPPPSPSTTM